MKYNTFSILKILATTPSESGQENAVGDVIKKILIKEKFTVKTIPVDANGFNIFACVNTPLIVLASHMDTVPCNNTPYKETDSKFFGRGVCDAKGSIAAMLTAAIRAKQNGISNFGLLFTVGEEVDFRGAKQVMKTIKQLPFTVVGEPTKRTIVNGQFGCQSITITAYERLHTAVSPKKESMQLTAY